MVSAGGDAGAEPPPHDTVMLQAMIAIHRPIDIVAAVRIDSTP